MSNNWAIITPVEQKVIEKQGFTFLQNDTVHCGNCNKPLIDVIKVKETETVTAIKVKCPHCNDTSFWYKIKGKIYLQAVDGLHISSAPIDVKNDIIYSTIEVKKNEPLRK